MKYIIYEYIKKQRFYYLYLQKLSDFFDNIFDHFLCAFRKGHGCQTTLLRLLEDWKQALDCNEYIVAILMDLSKAYFLVAKHLLPRQNLENEKKGCCINHNVL
jgi:hypothetical protein